MKESKAIQIFLYKQSDKVEYVFHAEANKLYKKFVANGKTKIIEISDMDVFPEHWELSGDDYCITDWLIESLLSMG